VDSALDRRPAEWHRRVIDLTWPVILANITIPLVGLADVAVMGRLPDPAYIGAVAVGSAIFSAMYWLFSFLRTGSTGLVAQAYGARDTEMVVGTFARASSIGLALGFAMILAQWPIRALMLTIFDASANVETLAATYFDIRIFGAPALLVYLAEMGLLFGLQQMRTTLILSVGLNITNLALDLLLVVGFGMGVEGVAYGTVIAEWAAALAGLGFVAKALDATSCEKRKSDPLWQREKVVQLFHVGSNLIVRTFFVQLPFFFGTLLAAGLGDVTLALHGILMQLFFVMTYGIDGFAHTVETLAGYAYGARNQRDLRQACLYCAFWGVLLALAIAVAYYLLGPAFVTWLTTSIEVHRAAESVLPWLIIAPLLCVGAFLFDGIFIGTTHLVEMRNAMILSAVVWAGVLAMTYQPLGYHGVWLAMSVFMAVRTLMLWLYYPRIERHALES
jgi:MATE family multidrug resistance protein